MNYKIAVIPGDGIGPEVTAEAVKAWTLQERNSDMNLIIHIFWQEAQP